MKISKNNSESDSKNSFSMDESCEYIPEEKNKC